MFPYLNILGLKIPMYGLFIAIGLMLALFLFAKLCDKDKIPVKVSNFYLVVAAISIVIGFVFATLFQSFYDFLESGVFKIGGMTFMGGLIGGAGTFFLSYLIFRKPAHTAVFSKICANALCAVALAHSLGRLGCFFAGCCYGIKTDSFLGVKFPFLSYKVFPTQLFEAVFLLALFFVLFFFRKHSLYIYPLAYGVFRFFLEYLRGDDRGQFISALTPSQIQSIIMVAIGIGILLYIYVLKDKFIKKKALKQKEEPAKAEESLEKESLEKDNNQE